MRFLLGHLIRFSRLWRACNEWKLLPQLAVRQQPILHADEAVLRVPVWPTPNRWPRLRQQRGETSTRPTFQHSGCTTTLIYRGNAQLVTTATVEVFAVRTVPVARRRSGAASLVANVVRGSSVSQGISAATRERAQ